MKCIRCEIFGREKEALKEIRGPLGNLVPLCEECIEEIEMEDEVFTPDPIFLQNEQNITEEIKDLR